MKNIERWKSAADRLMERNHTGFKVRNSFCTLLDFIHREDWQGACHASSTVLYLLLAAQDIQAEICLGEVRFGNVYFDHSWVEVDGNIYDAAVSNTLVQGLFFPPVFRGISLSNCQPTELQYGVSSGQGYDASAEWIRSISVTEYINAFPNYPHGLFGLAKLIGRYGGLRLNIAKLEKCTDNTTWKERP